MDRVLSLYLLWIICMVIMLKFALFIWYLVRCYFLPKFGFKKRLIEYGEWAVVTGATDGIGKEYAKQLADHGLNVVLISRTKAKLDALAGEIINKSKVKVKVIAYNFSNVADYSSISNELAGLEIGILINNVGQSYGEMVTFDKCDVEKTVNIMNVNMISNVKMTCMILPGMVNRERGAVVHISSGSIYVALPSLNIYSATKLFMKRFVNTLQLESNGNVDHQLLTPMYVESNMSKQKPGLAIPTEKDYVESAIKTIGIANDTCGYFSHELVYILMKILPISVMWSVIKRYKSSVSKKE